MFTQLRFQNFKSWKDTGEIRMAPLTGFFGTNSSGKTAILQFLLMLKQTVESSDRRIILNTGGPYVELGSSYNYIYQHKLPKTILISFQWQPSCLDYEPLFPTICIDFSGSIIRSNPSLISFEASINLAQNDIIIENFAYTYEMKPGNRLWKSIGMQHQDRKYMFFAEHDFFTVIGQKYEELLPPPVKIYGFPSDAKTLFKEDSNFLDELALSLECQFQSLYYLGPLRDYPKRIYNWSGEQPQDVGQRGENAVAALLASRREDPQVQQKVGFWLRELKLIHEYKLEPIRPDRQEYEMLVRCTAGSSWVSIKDVGFGISQILPVLVLCYYAPRGSTIIFEQPEIHLHPSVQAGLADVFIDAIKTRDVQIIIESHSEHLLRRLQRRIAEEKQGITNQDTALYFCRMGEDGASVLEPLQVDTYGNINNWPDDFFGDILGDLVKMTEAEMQRQMQEPQN